MPPQYAPFRGDCTAQHTTHGHATPTLFWGRCSPHAYPPAWRSGPVSAGGACPLDATGGRKDRSGGGAPPGGHTSPADGHDRPPPLPPPPARTLSCYIASNAHTRASTLETTGIVTKTYTLEIAAAGFYPGSVRE